MSSIELTNVNVDGIDNFRRVSGLLSILRERKTIDNSKDCVIPILKNINFSAKKGDRIGIVGKNGSGKTSLLRTICGNYPPKNGSISVKGKILSMLSTGIEFRPYLSGRDNIKLAFVYNNNLHLYNKDIVEKIIEFSELGAKIEIPIANYSSGMLARLAFSANIFQDGSILITDEIFATGDVHFIEKSRAFMIKKWETMDIAITVSHAMGDIEQLTTKCYLINDGEIVNFGDTKCIIQEYYKLIGYHGK